MKVKCWMVVLSVLIAVGSGLAWLARDTQPVQEIKMTIKVAKWVHNMRKKLRDIKNTIFDPQHEERSDSR